MAEGGEVTEPEKPILDYQSPRKRRPLSSFDIFALVFSAIVVILIIVGILFPSH
jgi:hypothetical protein